MRERRRFSVVSSVERCGVCIWIVGVLVLVCGLSLVEKICDCVFGEMGTKRWLDVYYDNALLLSGHQDPSPNSYAAHLCLDSPI